MNIIPQTWEEVKSTLLARRITEILGPPEVNPVDPGSIERAMEAYNRQYAKVLDCIFAPRPSRLPSVPWHWTKEGKAALGIEDDKEKGGCIQ